MSTTQSPIWLLGIETSGDTCTAALARDGELFAEKSARIRNIHSRMLAPFVQDVLVLANIGMDQLAGIVLSAGPGSFTGLRIGYSLAKGLAHGAAIPLVEVPTLDVWAYQSGAQPEETAVVPLIDAHRGEVFCAVYRWHGENMERVSDYTLVKPAELGELTGTAALLTGSDAGKLRPQLQAHLPRTARFLLPLPPAPQSWALLALGHQKWSAGDFADRDHCEPLYLRKFKGAT